MDVVDSSRISRYLPPTISRHTEPAALGAIGRHEAAADRNPAKPINPLAALFGFAATPPSAAPRVDDSPDEHPNLGRFVDVIA